MWLKAFFGLKFDYFVHSSLILPNQFLAQILIIFSKNLIKILKVYNQKLYGAGLKNIILKSK